MRVPKSPKLPLRVCSALALSVALWGCDAGKPSLPQQHGLRILIDGPAEALDPRMVFETQGLRISRLLFASLVTIDPDTLEPVPSLASAVTVEGGTRYRVRLREGLHFADGSVLDATDVIATFRSISDPRLKSRYAASYARIRTIERVSDLEVLFEIDAPHAPFMTDLEFPVLRSEDVGKLWTEDDVRFAVSSGPFALQSWTNRVVQLGPNPHWRGSDRRSEHVTFITITSDNTRAMRLLAGEGDIIAALPSTLLPLFTRRDDFAVLTAPGINTTYLGVHTRHPPLDTAEARRSLKAALDKKLLIEARLEGNGVVAHSWIPPAHWAALPVRAPESHQAGRLPTAQLTLRTTSDHGRVATARAISSMLREHGLDIEVRPSEKQTLLSDLSKGRFDLALLSVPEVIEPHVLSWFFSSERIPEDGRSGANRWRLANTELDEAFERGVGVTGIAERKQSYARVQRILSQQLPVIPLWHENVTLIVRRDLRDLRVPRHGRYDFLLEQPKREPNQD